MGKGAHPPKAEETPREVELKLELGRCDPEQLATVDLIREAGEGRQERLDSVYFDTPAFDLREAGVSFRVRRVGEDRWVQTVKAQRGNGAGGAGLFDRDEWEQDIAGEGPDLDAAAGTALEPLLRDRSLREAIRPLFAVRVDRTTYDVDAGSVAAELIVDRGVVQAGERTDDLCELELELRRGEPAELYGLARSLGDALPLRLGTRTKAERGYALVEGKARKAVKAGDPGLHPGMTAAEAFQAIGRACLAHLVANERLLHATRDANVVHQMRVAMRRFRAAISLFRDVVADGRRDHLRAEMKWISNELGRARDLDVFIEKVVGPVREEHPDEPALTALEEDYRRRREGAYDAVLAAVDSPRFRHLVLDAAAWLETGDWLRAGNPGASEPVDDYAAAELRARRRKVRRRGATLAQQEPHARHQVRIEVKKLRYAVEFFAPLFGGKKALKRREAFLTALEDLQEYLGDLNDMAVGQEMHGGAVGDDPGEEPDARAARLLAEHQAAKGDASLKPALKAYREVAEAGAFWK